VGLCLQDDAVSEHLTMAHHLHLVAAMRGMSPQEAQAAATALANELSIDPAEMNRAAGKLSGGYRRVLSVAMALIGDPLVVVLDEPTTGMDPINKRALWNALRQRRSMCAMLLTTHSMEEAEALATRIGIFVNGRQQVLGSPSHLKAKFGRRLRLQFRLAADSDLDEGCATVRRALSPLVSAADIEVTPLESAAWPMCEVNVPNSLKLSSVFEALEALRAEGQVLDYLVTHSSLDEVFCRVTREQHAA